MKKLIIIVVILILIIFSGILYLNNVFLPKKIKSIVISSLVQQTHKNVTLGSLEFNIFKGLILRDLVIADNQNVILSTKRVRCTIFVWPIFKKQIIIPSIDLDTPYIFLERRKDGSFNLQDIFMSSPMTVKVPEAEGVKSKKSEFSVSVYKLTTYSGNIVFQDDTLPVQFKKEIKNIEFHLWLSLPVSVQFKCEGEITNKPPTFIFAGGEYKILKRELAANLSVINLLPNDFEVYYNNLDISLLSGSADFQAKLNFNDQLLHIDASTEFSKLVLAKEKVKASLNLYLESRVDYDLQAKKVSFDGNCDIQRANISGLGFLGELKNLNGKIVFNERSLLTQGLKGKILGAPFEANLWIKDFSVPVLDINTNLNLSFLSAIAKDKFNFTYISSAFGKADLFVKLQPDGKGGWIVQGKANVTGAGLKLDKQESPIENIFATLEFNQQGFSWSNAKFKYQGIDYQSSGELAGFSAPNIKLQLSSRDLSLAGDFGVAGKLIKINQAKGKYLDSQFLISGEIDNSDAARPKVEASGKISLGLGGLSKTLAGKYPFIRNMQPKGQLDTQFTFSGPIHDFKNCLIQAKFTSNNFSLYGLNSQDFLLDYLQEKKIAKISSMRIAFYDGVLNASAALNLDTVNLPYHVELQAEGVRLEKLKKDTLSKDKNISGVFQGDIKLSGFSGDLNKLSGVGKFSIKDGKLWELNLLQGMGKLLFASDLGKVELSECACDFLVKNSLAYTDNLKLKGNVAELSGSLKIGFNGSLGGDLEVNILSDMVPLSGTLKDVTTAFMGQVGKFGVIKLSGTLQQPKYKFQPMVGNIVKGLTDIFFGKQQ